MQSFVINKTVLIFNNNFYNHLAFTGMGKVAVTSLTKFEKERYKSQKKDARRTIT